MAARGDAWLRRARPAIAPVALWALAFALRLLLAGGGAYGDEAAHYYMARHGPQDPDNVVPAGDLLSRIWWERPLFSVLLAPGAAFGFLGYRVGHAAVAALLPALGWLLLRQRHVGQPLAAAAGLVLAVHPVFVGWGARVFPDSLMSVLVLAGWLASGAGRIRTAAALLVAATWVKEVAALSLLLLALPGLPHALRSRKVGLYPLRLDERRTAALFAGIAAPLPLLLAIVLLDAPRPGWSTSGLTLATGSGLLLSLWLVPAVLAGLAWPQSRGACAFALLYPAFYLVYGLLLGRGVEAWYLILPASLGVVAAAAALSEAALRLRVPAARVAGLAVLLLLAAPAVVPGLAVAHPGGQTPPTLAMLREEGGGPGELEQAVAVLEGKDWNGVFLVDVGWFYTAYPFSERAAAVGVGDTGSGLPVEAWAAAMDHANATVLHKVDRPLNVALRETYSDCSVHEGPTYVVLRRAGCEGRLDALRQALVRAQVAASAQH